MKRIDLNRYKIINDLNYYIYAQKCGAVMTIPTINLLTYLNIEHRIESLRLEIERNIR